MGPRKNILVRISWLFFLLPLSPYGEALQEGAAIARPETFPACLDFTQKPSFLQERISVVFEGMKLPQIIEHLNAKLGMPVSFIEGPLPVQIEMRVQDEPVHSFLERLLGQAPGYRCAVIENHVVIYHDEHALHQVVERVSIARQSREQAAHSYVEHVSRQIEGFEGLSVLLGGALESPVFDERVTLAREATVIEHFGQLLGKDPSVFFWLRYASTGSRYLTFGSVPP